jgi:hypothetical protein
MAVRLPLRTALTADVTAICSWSRLATGRKRAWTTPCQRRQGAGVWQGDPSLGRHDVKCVAGWLPAVSRRPCPCHQRGNEGVEAVVVAGKCFSSGGAIVTQGSVSAMNLWTNCSRSGRPRSPLQPRGLKRPLSARRGVRSVGLDDTATVGAKPSLRSSLIRRLVTSAEAPCVLHRSFLTPPSTGATAWRRAAQASAPATPARSAGSSRSWRGAGGADGAGALQRHGASGRSRR